VAASAAALLRSWVPWALYLVLGGCAVKSRVLKEPLPTPVTDLKWTAAAPEGFILELDQVIVRNSGGSWVRDANWDEYVLTVRNDSSAPVEIERFNLYSDKLPGPEQSSTSREQLEARSSATLRGLKDAGIVAGAGVASAGVVVAIVGTGGPWSRVLQLRPPLLAFSCYCRLH
jgi:hypothetical protein